VAVGREDDRLTRILQGALFAVQPPADGRRQLVLAARRMEHHLAWKREVLYYRAQEWISLAGGGAPRFGWMTLPLRHNYLLGFPKPRFSW